MYFFDSHAHLSDEKFEGEIDLVLERALAQNVNKILLPASDLEDSKRVVDISSAYSENMLAAVGVHPHEADSFDDNTATALKKLSQSKTVVAIGEIGLDYHYDFSPRATQKRVFRTQIELAYELSLPLILHDREAHGDFLELLQQAKKDGILLAKPGVVHCYSGSVEFSEELLKLGFYLGFDGPVTFKNARHALDVIKAMPKERLLIETDSPYLTPVPYRGKRNEPAHVVLVAKKISEILNMSLEELASLTYNNASTLFFQ